MNGITRGLILIFKMGTVLLKKPHPEDVTNFYDHGQSFAKNSAAHYLQLTGFTPVHKNPCERIYMVHEGGPAAHIFMLIRNKWHVFKLTESNPVTVPANTPNALSTVDGRWINLWYVDCQTGNTPFSPTTEFAGEWDPEFENLEPGKIQPIF